MATIVTKDGVEIFYKDWGSGQPIVFSHGWPLSSDDWDNQMMFFSGRAFGSSLTTAAGMVGRPRSMADNDLDTLCRRPRGFHQGLDLRNAIHIGHSTGGGEVVRYIARHGESRVAKAAILAAIPPLMVQAASNPGGLPKKVFDDLQAQLAANRSQFYLDFASGPFYGFNRPGAKVSQGLIRNWWRQAMMGSAKAQYDGVVAFFADRPDRGSEEDQRAGTGWPWRRRPDCALCQCRATVGKAAGEGNAQDLQGVSARHAVHRARDYQRRSALIHQSLETRRNNARNGTMTQNHQFAILFPLVVGAMAFAFGVSAAMVFAVIQRLAKVRFTDLRD